MYSILQLRKLETAFKIMLKNASVDQDAKWEEVR